MNFETVYPTVEHIVAAVANEYGRKGWRYGATHEDFQQEFIAWMLDHEAFCAEFIEEHGQEAFDKYLTRCLQNEGKDYMRDVKAQALGYHRDDEYFYAENELKKSLLPSMFDKSKWLEPPQSEGRSTKAPAEGGNWIATLADVAQAYEKLDLDDQNLLRNFHQHGMRNMDLAKAHGVTDATMSYRHDRAIKRLQKALGGEKPRPEREATWDTRWRGRHAVSNSQARAMTSASYED